MKIKLLLLFILSVFSFQACKHCDCEKNYNKLDAQSKIIFKESESLSSETALPILIQTYIELNDNELKPIKELKIKNFTKAGKIISCSANIESIRALLEMDIVKAIEIKKEKKTN